MDDRYHTIASVSPGLGRTGSDVHEFTVLPGGTALTTIFQPTPYDLTSFGVKQSIGWVIDGIFQEINIQTGEVLFEWRSLDHVPLNETYNLLGSNSDAGTGNTTALAWDYL
jgi:Arylsulfotransferase (ASST)